MSRRTPWPLAALLIVALAAPPALGGKKQARRLRRDVTSLAKKRPLDQLKAPKKGWVTAGGVIINPESRQVLLVRNRKEKREGRSGWTWPKGRIDPGESPAKTARRESREESGAKATVGPHLVTLKTKRALRAYFLMLLDADKGDYHRKETLEVKWVSLRRARKMLDRGRDHEVLDAVGKTLADLE
ncbi:MAG: NUDIX domain-containing protein [Myxococcales bacterium]|nr:NUDIX domain-containing protein [Myxococcales bacterium]